MGEKIPFPVWKIPFPVSETFFRILLSNEYHVPNEVFGSGEQKWMKNSITCLKSSISCFKNIFSNEHPLVPSYPKISQIG